MQLNLKFVAKNPSVSAGLLDIARITRFYFRTDAKGERDSVQNFRSPQFGIRFIADRLPNGSLGHPARPFPVHSSRKNPWLASVGADPGSWSDKRALTRHRVLKTSPQSRLRGC